MDDGEEVRKDEDRAFILRLPPNRAREVRQMLAENNLQELRLHVDPAPRQGQLNRWDRANWDVLCCVAGVLFACAVQQCAHAVPECLSVRLRGGAGLSGEGEGEGAGRGHSSAAAAAAEAVLLGMQDGKQFQGPHWHI